MDVKFGVGETPTEQVTQPSTTTTQAVATVQSGPVAKRNFVLGDLLPSFDQIILPRINLAQNIGELSDVFEPGSIVLNRTTALYLPPDIDRAAGVVKKAGTPPVIMTVLGFKETRFVEKTEGGAKGIILNNEADIPAANGTLDWNEYKLKKSSGVKLFQPLVDAAVLIQRPECNIKSEGGDEYELCPDDDSTFVHEVDGKKYALALWALKSTLYTALAKGVWFTHRKTGCLRGGYPTWSYNIATKEKKFGDGKASYIPTGTPFKKNTPEFMGFVKQILEPPQA